MSALWKYAACFLGPCFSMLGRDAAIEEQADDPERQAPVPGPHPIMLVKEEDEERSWGEDWGEPKPATTPTKSTPIAASPVPAPPPPSVPEEPNYFEGMAPVSVEAPRVEPRPGAFNRGTGITTASAGTGWDEDEKVRVKAVRL